MHYQPDNLKLAYGQRTAETPLNQDSHRKRTKSMKGDSSNQCKICGLINFNAWALTIHMRRHNNEKPAKCSYCPAAFVNNTELKSHINTHTKEKSYKCRFCTKWFTNKSSKYVHEDTHKILEHKCKYCSEKFHSQIERRIHQKKHGREALTCRFCIKKFVNEEFLKRHEETEHGKALKCIKCKLKFQSLNDLNIHKLKHRASGGQRISKSISLRSNEVSIFQDSDVKLSSYFFTCGICSEKFSFQVDLTNHIETLHPSKEKESIYKFKCSVCNKSFDTKVKLRGHMIGHGPKKYSCPHCNHRSARGSDLSKHIEAKHLDVKSFKCSECELVFAYYTTFISHKLRHGDKKFKCDMCEKAYYVKSRLSLHRRISHYSANPVCEHCGKVFRNILTLKAHQKRFHDHPLPICLCNNCGETMSINDILSHKFVCLKKKLGDLNNKIKGPICSYCNITFSFQRDLLKHYKQMHSSKVFSCQYCKKEYLSASVVQKHIERKHIPKNHNNQRRKDILTSDEKKELRKHSKLFFITNLYECFACGYSFKTESELSNHLNEGICLETNYSKTVYTKEKQNYNITKIYEGKDCSQVLNDYEVKVIPLCQKSEPLNITILPYMPENKNFAKIIHGKLNGNVGESPLPNVENKLSNISHTLKTEIKSSNSVHTHNTPENSDSNIVHALDFNEEVCQETEETSNNHLQEVMSSQTLIKLLQTKTIDVDGTPFIPYVELLEHLKCVSGIDVSTK